jgi:DNA-binding HxlR family transcriptional regulator
MAKPLTLNHRALQSRDAIELLSNKWRITVLHVLGPGPLRANDLLRAIDMVSPKVLTQTLRGMERDGLIDRRVRAVVPAHVEYSLTPMAVDVVPLLRNLCHWAKAHSAKRDEARSRYDRRVTSKSRGAAPRSR